MKKMIPIHALLLALLLPVAALAAGMGQSAGHDLDRLWARAQQQYDLDREDAVLLLESRQITFGSDGTMQTRVHRVVWIGTSVGVRAYADLRVPWNSATSTLEVEKLRTWRVDRQDPQGRWWPDAERISDTAVVHTLPHALDRADDYTDMRETMLLHDGVELGCIMETAYTITERGVPAGGGVSVVPQQDPAVLWELRLMTPPGMEIHHAELNGAAAPVSINPTKGWGLLWTAENVPALKRPVTASPEAYEPAVAWSTWESWQQLDDHWQSAFEQAAALAAGQAAELQEKLHPAQSKLQKLQAVGKYLGEMTRPIRYDTRFWRFAPRTAERTLATAYGHDLDRAVLAAALVKAAGLTPSPMLVGSGAAWPAAAKDIPRLQGMDHIVLRIAELGVSGAVLDPGTGQVKGMDVIFGHPFYYLTAGGVHPPHLPQPEKAFTLAVNLAAAEEGGWQGEGFLRGQAFFSHYSEILGAEDLGQGFLQEAVGGVLAGAELTAANPVILQDGLVEVTFKVKVSQPEPDDLGRTALLIGRPVGGLLDRLPGDVHLYEPERRTPVLNIGAWRQSVTVRLEVTEEDLLHRPQPRQVTNEAGSFDLEATYADGWLTLVRTLQLSFGQEGDIPAGQWTPLRALLLEEANPVHGTVLLR